MRLPERVEHQAFPRAAALAEATWSPAAARNWDSFMARLGAQFARYRRLGIRFADSAFEPRFALGPAGDGGGADALRVTLSQQSPFGTIRLTRDGSVPGPGSEPYAGPFDAAAGSRCARPHSTASSRCPMPCRWRSTQRRSAGARAKSSRIAAATWCCGSRTMRLSRPIARSSTWTSSIPAGSGATWISRAARRFTTAVGQVPFNFQIGRDVDAIRRGDARTADGELEIRTGNCAGEPVARIPLAEAAASDGVTVIGPVRIAPQAGRGDLCLRFARPRIDPIWTLAWVALGE